ncbi:MAG: heavy metal translocating P-type ATPase metal-binding domain-containing protein [Bacteroidetes bacterium]|nr:heavy metal translocating P-type ATPase metal-binding domain-containing protein [Bacteroidota bacterium]
MEDKVKFDDKNFCCTGCKLVYEVLAENNLCNYYQLDTKPGFTIPPIYRRAVCLSG